MLNCIITPAPSLTKYLGNLYLTNDEHLSLDDISIDYTSKFLPFLISEITDAVKHLSSNKAIGLDAIRDTDIHSLLKDDKATTQVTKTFSNWFTNGMALSNVKSARIVPLRKSDSQFSEVGDIRTLVILP